MCSMEVVACHGVLQNLLKQFARGPDLWESAFPKKTPFWSPPILCTVNDVENAREVSTMWKEYNDTSVEYACIRLARWDYNQEEGVHWFKKEEFEALKFNDIWSLFGKSWRMATPILDAKLRTAALADLSCLELDRLRTLLIDPGNTVIRGHMIQDSAGY